VPEDRHRTGLVVAFEEWENSALGYHGDPRFLNGPLLDILAIRNDARAKIAQYDIRPPNCRLKTANFSGGNQQKIVLAREMERDPSVLLVGQPTRGVDIGAIEAIHRRMIEARDRGLAILLISAELNELRSLSDRLAVLYKGQIVATLDQAQLLAEGALETIGAMMTGARTGSTDNGAADGAKDAPR
jgi:simple sugar transport system ATP-binding protein